MAAVLQCFAPYAVTSSSKKSKSGTPKKKRVKTVSEPFAYETIMDELLTAVKRICPGWLVAHRDDLVQVGMMRIMDIVRKSPEGEIPSNAYIRKVAFSAMIDEIRRQKRLAETTLEDEENGEVPFAGNEHCAQTRVESDHIGGAIKECLLRLVTPRRLTVALHLKGHSVPESARLLGWTPKKTENLVYRGLSDLRSCLSNKGVSP